VTGFLERIKALEEKIERDIASPSKCSIMGVFPIEGQSPPFPFNYTIGLSDMGWPELIMAGLDNRIAARLINEIIERCVETTPPVAGREFLKIANTPLRLRAISEEQRDKYMCWAVDRQKRIGRAEPDALQVIFPDDEGRWPDDPECDAKVQYILSLPVEEQVQ
jgi:hypothetical protein